MDVIFTKLISKLSEDSLQLSSKLLLLYLHRQNHMMNQSNKIPYGSFYCTFLNYKQYHVCVVNIDIAVLLSNKLSTKPPQGNVYTAKEWIFNLKSIRMSSSWRTPPIQFSTSCYIVFSHMNIPQPRNVCSLSSSIPFCEGWGYQEETTSFKNSTIQSTAESKLSFESLMNNKYQSLFSKRRKTTSMKKTSQLLCFSCKLKYR